MKIAMPQPSSSSAQFSAPIELEHKSNKASIDEAQKAIRNTNFKSNISLCDRIFKCLKDTFTKLIHKIRKCFNCNDKKSDKVENLSNNETPNSTNKIDKTNDFPKKGAPIIEAPKKEPIIEVPDKEKQSDETLKIEESNEKGKNNEVRLAEQQDVEFGEVELPDEMKLRILSYLDPKNLRTAALINKTYSRLSDEQKIEWLNQNKVPISMLGLNFISLSALLERVGSKLQYLEVDYKRNAFSQALEFIKYCPNLRHLIIKDYNSFQDKDIEKLAQSQKFNQLEILELDDSCGTKVRPEFTQHLEQEGIKALAKSPNFPQLQELIIKHKRMHDKGFVALAESQNFKGLRKLHLEGNLITNEGVRVFADSSNFPYLDKISFRGNEISEEGVKAFANSAKFSNLEVLDLSWNPIKKGDSVLLFQSPNFPKLEHIVVSNYDIAQEDINKLKNSLKAKIHVFDGPRTDKRDDWLIKWNNTRN